MPEKSKHSKLTRSQHSVLPEVETLISIQTHPNAVCSLVHDEINDRRLQLDADDQGIVRFHVKAHTEWKPLEVHLDYTDEIGGQARHTLSLRADNSHDAPITPNQVKSAPLGTLRPALEGDPMSLSIRELVARGYPPRPDPLRSPSRYARWMQLVSQPFTSVPPRLVPHPETRFVHPAPAMPALHPKISHVRPSPAPPQVMSPTLPLPPPMVRPMFNSNSGIWSGAYLTQPIGQFYYIQGDWTVPGVLALPGISPAYSAAAEWIGLDNSGTDLYQSGTDSECWDLFGFWTFTNYWMWIESLPFAPWAVANFPVSPGDSISVDMFVADQYGTTWFQNGTWGGLTPADNSVWFMLYNRTQRVSYWGTLPTASQSLGGLTSTPFTGSTAEFIVERPTVNGSAAPLACFILAAMQGCWYGDAQYGDQLFALSADGSSPFDGNLQYLNMQNGTTNDLLDIAISAPDPASPQGSEILWLWTHYQ